jgi:hypothetical protein
MRDASACRIGVGCRPAVSIIKRTSLRATSSAKFVSKLAVAHHRSAIGNGPAGVRAREHLERTAARHTRGIRHVHDVGQRADHTQRHRIADELVHGGEVRSLADVPQLSPSSRASASRTRAHPLVGARHQHHSLCVSRRPAGPS